MPFSGGQTEYSDEEFADDEFAWKVEMLRAGKLKPAVAEQVRGELALREEMSGRGIPELIIP